jgi:hypothetical protein
MHISLDQAIGRQPRLNRVGQSLLNIASGASAAYSLRSLTGDEPKAVRIRRDGDNEERDFTTAEIVNEAAAWTNGLQETTLPADVATSAAAYSLRKVKSDYTGHAVRIRRKSDDVEVNVSFDTNDEVSTSSPIENTTEQGGESGSTTATTLGEFLTEDVDITNRLIVPSDVATRFVVTSSTDASNYTVSINNGSGEATFSQMRSGLFGEGHYRLRGTLTASNLVGDIKIQTNGGLPDNTQFVSITNGTNNLDFEFDITGDGSTTSAGSVRLFFFINDVASATLEVSNLTWEVTTPDAAVHTWYDQSGNSKNATQTTDANQPLIAAGGVLQTKLGKPAINFTTGTTFLENASLSITETEVSYFIVSQAARDGATSSEARNTTFFSFTSDTTFIGTPNSSSQMSWKRFSSANSFSLSFNYLNTTNLHSAIGTSSGANYYLNSSSIYSDSLTGSNSTRTGIRIGTKFFVTSHDSEGYFSEFIIYNSDQTNNRFKIESNINNHYTIYTAAQNGFVEKWYDQSGGTVEDLEQTTDSKQPSLVTSGTLNTRNGRPIIKFIQANSTFLENSNLSMFPSGSDFALTVFHAMHIDPSSGGRIGVFGCNNGGNAPPTNGYRFGSGTSRRIATKFRDASDTTTELNVGFYTANTDSILTYKVVLNNGAASLSGFNNGSLLQESTASVTDQSYSIPTDKAILGARGTGDNFSDSEFFEVIAFATDKSSERGAIEQSLSNYYGITLS